MKYFLLLINFLPVVLFSQEPLRGIVTETNQNNERVPLLGANVYWLDTTIGTTTDSLGKFAIPYQNNYSKLIISYVGFKTDTLQIDSPQFIRHELQAEHDLNEVTVTSRKQATAKSYLKAANVITVSSDELLKAACCNLSESFETNPSIDVNFADALTGTRQIKMLGLTSPYILITTENIPAIRGASQAFGLSFIPGTWVESIQITKGAGSVINGFESIAGQINTELVKPLTDDRLFVNLYGATSRRVELNTHFNTQVSNKWHTGLYVHGNYNDKKHDVNDDGFMDMPVFDQINLMNRWQYVNNEKGIVSFINLKYLNDHKQTGQIEFEPSNDRGTTNAWGSEIDTRRVEVSGKLGYVNPEIPYKSIGLQTAFSNHVQESYFGLNQYDIEHNSVYANAIYNTIIGDSRSKVKTGMSFTYDHYSELVNQSALDRNERSIGAFFEYAFDNLDDLNLTAGIRIDNHNLLGIFVTPRLHVRYSPWEKSAIRASIGRGKRSANIFAENQQIFSTSRAINILDSNGEIYGLDPEIAWNFGFSYLQGFNLFDRQADITFDFYRTEFTDQVVVDYEDPRTVNFYNLNGSSFANSFQIEANYNPFERFDLRLAYKYYDVKTDFRTGRLEKPLVPKHRFFANISYNIPSKSENGRQWKLDATFNWLGRQRFANTSANPEEYRLSQYSPNVTTLNAQVTRVFSPKFEVYLGGENMTNVRQSNPILGAEDPFGPYFDTTFVYGPIFGSNYYVGLRYKIER